MVFMGTKNKKSERVSFRLRNDQLDYLDNIANKYDCSRSAAVRQIILSHRAIMTSSLSELLKGSPLEDVSVVPDGNGNNKP